ncbi:hypothetical protein [Desulfomicrobium escambiense]|uniref:hypothetical protein n=1 Tax=Desulfomicrobium escambiense TaxID=29503 RepID=UPI000407E815|nr:hypothetical protein [Desulfomicrobium escambiense]
MTKLILTFLLLFISCAALAADLSPAQFKDGAETRCIPGVDDQEFTEDNFAGAYSLGPGKCVFIEDARKRGGQLVLHADCLGLHCPLYRFNKFVYVYGAPPGSAAPVQGTVTFMSDGSQVTQIILQHEGRQAYFPMRQKMAWATAAADAGPVAERP